MSEPFDTIMQQNYELAKKSEDCYSCSKPLGDMFDTYHGHKLCLSCYKALATKKALELVDGEIQTQLDRMSVEVLSAKQQIKAMEERHAIQIADLTNQIVQRDEYIAELLSDETVLATEKWKERLE